MAIDPSRSKRDVESYPMRSTSKSLLSSALLGVACIVSVTSSVQAGAGLTSHQAVYDITLAEAHSRTGISDMNGRLVFQFAGSKCDGYTSDMRFVLRIQLPDDVRVTDQQTATFESGDGSDFQFITKTYTDSVLDRETKGSASLNKRGTKVTLKKPEPIDVSLGASNFPTAHLEEVLEHARAGDRFYETTLFDGSEGADRLISTSVVIGARKAASGDNKIEDLKSVDYWPVSIAYFDPLKETGGESMPEYRMDFRLYDNGITSDLVLDYGDFSLNAEMKELKMLDAPSCDAVK